MWKCGAQQSSQHFESLLGKQCLRKVKPKIEESGSWVCLELPEFLGFSLLLKPLLDRTGSTVHPWALPSPPVLQPSLEIPCPRALTMPWDGAAADPHQLQGVQGWMEGLECSERRLGQVGAGSQQQRPWGGCLGRGAAHHRCVPRAHCTHVLPLTLIRSSCPHQQQPKKSPNWPPLQPPQDADSTRV